MAGLKSITDLPLVENINDLHFIVNNTNSAKQATMEQILNFLNNEWDVVFEINADLWNLDSFGKEHVTLVKGDYASLQQKCMAGYHPKVLFKWIWYYGEHPFYQTWTANSVECTPINKEINFASFFWVHSDCGIINVGLKEDNTIDSATFKRWES